MSVLTALIIIGAVLAFIAALLFVRVRFDVSCSDETIVKLCVLGVKVTLYPKKRKKVKPSLFKKDYPSVKEKKKKAKDTKKSGKKKSDVLFSDILHTLVELIKHHCAKFFKYLRLDVSRIIVIVGGADAASSAITYGVVSQSVAYLLDFLDKNIKISKKRGGEINVLCDFTSQSIYYDIFISLSLTVWQILDIGLSLGYNYLKHNDILNFRK